SSPRMRQRHASLAAAQREESAARRSRWLPTVRGSVGLSRGMNLPNYSALSELNPQNRSFGFGLSASLPLFDGFQRGAAVAQAGAAREDAALQLRAERLGLEREVRSAMIDLENAFASLRLAERSAELSRQQVELTQEKYRLGGTVNFLDLQNVIDQAANAERQALQARFNFERARVNLEQLVGREVGR
ncbi:MAG TPA: TolC family protein, partial [Longimicrobiales bacterium]|nr:TolC family protein [Longimicrobiales bacterium]